MANAKQVRDRDSNGDALTLLITQDAEGRREVFVLHYRIGQTEKGVINDFLQGGRPGRKILGHRPLQPDNYFVKHLISLGKLGNGDAAGLALEQLDELLTTVIIILNGPKK